jgi:hypothetical protein
MNGLPKLPKHRRLILAAGIPRSGSTWLFNAIRGLLSNAGRTVEGAWVGDLDALSLPECDDLVVKLHDPDAHFAQLSPLAFTCHRDLRDVAASLRGMKWAETDDQLLNSIRQVRRQHEFWAARSVYDVAYEEIVSSPGPVASRIAHLLEVTLTAEKIDELVAELSGLAADPARMSERHDMTNLMHADHRIDGRPGSWQERLSPALGEAIAASHRDWLAKFGYICDAE